MFGSKDSGGELAFGYYLETLSLNGVEMGIPEDRERFTIGCVNCTSVEHPLVSWLTLALQLAKMRWEGRLASLLLKRMAR